MKQDQIRLFIRKIVVESFSDELDAFDMLAHEAIEDTLAGKRAVRGSRSGGSVKFGADQAIATLNFVVLLAGTGEAIKKAAALFKSVSGEHRKDVALLKLMWKEDLVRAGLSDDVAERIADSHVGDLLKVVDAR